MPVRCTGMRIRRSLTLLATALASATVTLVCTPLLWAMRADRRERVALEGIARERWPDVMPYDDDDPGVDVDGDPDEVDA